METQVTQSYGDLWRLVRLAKPSVPLLVFAGVSAALGAAATLWFPILTKSFVDQLSAGVTNWNGIALLATVLISSTVFGALSHYLLSRVGYEVVAALRQLLIDKMLALPVRAYDKSDTGDRVSRVIHDCESISQLVSSEFINMLSGLIVLVGSVVFLLLLDARLTYALLACIVGAFVVVVPVTMMMGALSQQVQDRTARLSGILTHVFSEIRLVKAFAAEPRERQRSQQEIDGLKAIGLKTARIHVALEPFMSLAISAALVIILAYGASRVVKGDIGVGTLTAYFLYIFNIALPMAGLAHFASELQKARGASMRIGLILQERDEEQGSGGEQRLPPGRLEFDNVSFAYEGSDKPVLDGVSLVFEPGSTTALVGVSGSGKTTVLSLIERFYRPTGGEIRYGGKPLDSYAMDAWRKSIGYVAQNSPVMPGTVRENITYGLTGSFSDADVRAAAREAGALAFIESMPQGFDSVLIEQGNNVSGGQRQRLAIARMFLRNPAILILDEATSNLDSETEQQVKAALETLMQGRTNIIVAHRLFTIMHTDRIYFIEDGRIAGAGNHLELLTSHAPYARLVEQQSDRPLVRPRIAPVPAAS